MIQRILESRATYDCVCFYKIVDIDIVVVRILQIPLTNDLESYFYYYIQYETLKSNVGHTSPRWPPIVPDDPR